MLKIWKRSYKKDDETRRTDSLHNREAPGIGKVGGSETQPSPPVSFHAQPIHDNVDSNHATAPPADIYENASSQVPASVPLRRTADEAELTQDMYLPSPKRLRSQSDCINLGHATDCSNSSHNGVNIELGFSTWMERLLSETETRNTLAVVPSEKVQNEVLAAAFPFCMSYKGTPVNSDHSGSTLIVYEKYIPDTVNSMFHELASTFSGAGPIITTEWQKVTGNDPITFTTCGALLQAIERRFLPLERVKLLVYMISTDSRDRSATKQFMNAHYNPLAEGKQPRILTITRSHPHFFLNERAHVVRLHNCALFAVQAPGEPDELPHTVSKPVELVVFYESQQCRPPTQLCRQLVEIDREQHFIRKHVKDAQLLLDTLGTFAADLLWNIRLSELEMTSRSTAFTSNPGSDSQRDLNQIRASLVLAIKKHVFALPSLDSATLQRNISPKFSELVKVLKACAPHGAQFRGVVFVQHRIVAIAIVNLLNAIGRLLPFLRPHAIYGHGTCGEALVQMEVQKKFAAGEINLLVATKFAEEMELPAPTCVIRFDLLDSPLSYALSRARAQGPECHLILMAERGSHAHRRLLAGLARLDRRMERWIDSLGLLAASPPPRMLAETIDPYRSDSDDDQDPEDFIQDPTTSSRIYPSDALAVVMRMASGLDVSTEGPALRPLFKFAEIDGDSDNGQSAFSCTALLPSGPALPQKPFTGSPAPSRSFARRTACYELCTELFNRGLLDYRLFPRPRRISRLQQRPMYVPPAVLVVQSEDEMDHMTVKQPFGQPYVRKKPDFWENVVAIINTQLHPVIVTVDVRGVDRERYHPLVLLTRLPLPPLRSFTIYISLGTAQVRFTPIEAFDVDAEHFEMLARYTKRFFRACSNRPLDCPTERVAYLLAPLKSDRGSAALTLSQKIPLYNGENCLDWDMISSALGHWVVPLRGQSVQGLEGAIQDSIIQERAGEFTRRYEAICVRPDMSPLSKIDAKGIEGEGETYLSIAYKQRQDFEGVRDLNQPLVEVRAVLTRGNYLSPLSTSILDARGIKYFLIPELCFSHTIPASTLRSGFLMASIMRRIDDILLTKELNGRLFDHKIVESALHTALTLPAAAMDFDYERLELLGDAFLKYLSSLYVFVTQPYEPEGVLHLLRQRLISNSSLLKNARGWFPTNFHLSEQGQKSQTTREASNGSDPEEGEINDPSPSKMDAVEPTARDRPPDWADLSRSQKKTRYRRRARAQAHTLHLTNKAVADLAEAVIGAAYLSGGRELGLWVAKRLNIPFLRVDTWSDFCRMPLAPSPAEIVMLDDDVRSAIEAIIGQKFENPQLLAQAFESAHPRQTADAKEVMCYERLEFIGDAILDFLTVEHIYIAYPGATPGDMTELKSAMVSNAALAAVCVDSGLHDFLACHSDQMAVQVAFYAQQMRTLKRANKGRQYWTEVEPPKVLGDLIEAVMGAIYISDNFTPTGVQVFYNKVLRPFFEEHIDSKSLSLHPTKVLFERFQAQGCHNFRISRQDNSNDSGDEHISLAEVIVHDVVLARASGPTVQSAARACSSLALDALDGDPKFVQLCDCNSKYDAWHQSRVAVDSPVMSEDVEMEAV